METTSGNTNHKSSITARGIHTPFYFYRGPTEWIGTKYLICCLTSDVLYMYTLNFQFLTMNFGRFTFGSKTLLLLSNIHIHGHS